MIRDRHGRALRVLGGIAALALGAGIASCGEKGEPAVSAPATTATETSAAPTTSPTVTEPATPTQPAKP